MPSRPSSEDMDAVSMPDIADIDGKAMPSAVSTNLNISALDEVAEPQMADLDDLGPLGHHKSSSITTLPILDQSASTKSERPNANGVRFEADQFGPDSMKPLAVGPNAPPSSSLSSSSSSSSAAAAAAATASIASLGVDIGSGSGSGSGSKSGSNGNGNAAVNGADSASKGAASGSGSNGGIGGFLGKVWSSRKGRGQSVDEERGRSK